MKEEHRWDNLVPEYEEEIFNVYRNDRKKIVTQTIKKHASIRKMAADFGCGVGRTLPLLSPLFKELLAIDFSQKSLDKAAAYGFNNVEFKQMDLGKKSIRIPKVDFALCVNVAISGKPEINDEIIKNVIGNVKKGGYGLFVMPSMESALFATWQLVNGYKDKGTKIKNIPEGDLERLKIDRKDSLHQGMLYVNGIRTRHYLLPELYSYFQTSRTDIESIERVEYNWETEIADPPANLKQPYPWDWMVEFKRTR